MAILGPLFGSEADDEVGQAVSALWLRIAQRSQGVCSKCFLTLGPMKHAILFMVTGKAFQQCEKPSAIQLRGRLPGKPSKKTFGCWCEAHPSRKPSGKGVGLP